MAIEKTFLQEIGPSKIWVYQYLDWPIQEGIDRVRVAVQGIRKSGVCEDQSQLYWLDRLIYGISGVALLIPPTNFVIGICMRNLRVERVSDEPFLSAICSKEKSEVSPLGQRRRSPEQERWLPQVHQPHDLHPE